MGETTFSHLSLATRITLDKLVDTDIVWSLSPTERDWIEVGTGPALGFVKRQIKKGRGTLHRLACDVYYVSTANSEKYNLIKKKHLQFTDSEL